MCAVEETGRFEGLNRRLSKLFESPRLSAISSSSSNDRMSIATSLSTDLSDSDRPMSLISTTSSDSLPYNHYPYENSHTGADMTQSLMNHFQNQKTDLDPDAVGAQKKESPCVEAVALSKVNQMHNNNNNASNRRSLRGSESRSPFSTKVSAITHKLSYVERVVVEIVETERMYVRDLRSIVEDYLGAIIDTPDLEIKPEQVSDLFGNIEDIYELNSELLQDLDSCDNDPVAVARCFVEKSQYFDIYTQYCTNYPNSVAALTECMRSKVLAKFFRDRQEMLKHSLPLGSYLLKPVQRILKYHLLLQEIAKHFDMEEDGYEVVEEAIGTMTGVAWYINDMKRKHEHAVRLQEIQSLLLNWKGLDLTTYGELVLEGTFRIQRARNDRTLFLFYKALFITRKRGDHFVYKTHIPCSSLMLIESTRDSLCFTITHYKNSKQQHNIQVRTVEEKRLWTHHIKELILENHHAIIPQKAKEAILEIDALYPCRYKYSPERVKKIMHEDPAVQSRQGRRQSEPPKNILAHFGDKNVLKHADSDGALLDIGDPLRSSVCSLVSRIGQTETPEEDEEEEEVYDQKPPLKPFNVNGGSVKDTGAELTASDEENEEENEEDEEVLMGDDQSKETGELYAKGLKRQKSQSSDKAEKRQSVDSQSSEQAPADFEPIAQESPPEEPCPEHQDAEETPCYVMPTDPQDSAVRTQVDDMESKHDVDQIEIENGEDLRALSSEEEGVLPAQDPGSILPPSVLDQASVIAERFINSLSRRGSLALDDGKYIGCLTPRLSSRSGSTKSLDCIDKPQFHNSCSEPSHCSSPREMQVDAGGVFSPLNGAGSLSSQSPNETDRLVFKRKDSTLSKQDKLLLDKIRGYYDHAENHDVAFSIKRRESLSYIPSGLVRNSVFKFNSLPRTEPKVETNVCRRINGSSNKTNGTSGSRPASWAHPDEPLSNHALPEPFFSRPKENASQVRSAEFANQLPVTDDEFKAPSEMFKVWEEMEKAHSDAMTERCGTSNQGEADKTNVIQGHMQNGDNVTGNSENEFDLHEPLHIIEDSDLSTITEESAVPSPESTSPAQACPGKVSHNESDYGQDYKMDDVIKLHPKILQLVQSANGDITDKMKSKVYQLARKYSQRVKCNKPVVQRHLKELEEDLRKNAIQMDKQTGKGKLKPALLSFPNYDQIIIQEHNSLTPISSCSSAEKPHKRFSFSPSCISPGITSPIRSGCRSPLSPNHTEKFDWPDVRELRSKYASKPVLSSVKSPPVNRSQSVPESIAEQCPAESIKIQNPVCKDSIARSASMNIGRISNFSNLCRNGRAHHRSIKGQPHTKLSGAVYQSPCLAGSAPEALHSSRLPSHVTSESFYVSAEAPLENDKKVIVVERLCNNDLTKDDHYVQIRSPTSREKISLKAVVDRCKAYQESDEYRKREAFQEEEDIQLDPTNILSDPKEATSQLLWETTDQNQESLVKNLRKKFQTLGSNT